MEIKLFIEISDMFVHSKLHLNKHTSQSAHFVCLGTSRFIVLTCFQISVTLTPAKPALKE